MLENRLIRPDWIMHRPENRATMDAEEMNPRTCIVTRQSGEAVDLIRFVAAPDGSIVADLARKLPGRGVWVKARREIVETAVRKNLFSRGLKRETTAAPALAADIDRLLENAAISALSLARKAGLVVTGFSKVDAAVRQGKALVLLHATDAAQDGVRKLSQAVHASVAAPLIRTMLASIQMDLALGGNNVIHAAALKGGASDALLRQIDRLERYRS